VLAAQADLEASPLKGALVGHVGDGNFHMVYLVDPAVRKRSTRRSGLADLMVVRALEAGGTCTVNTVSGWARWPTSSGSTGRRSR
jgi:D-lactate dehydrogenase (cytochrome)